MSTTYIDPDTVPFAQRRYSVSLWDHEMHDGQGGFSDELARDHLDGPNEGLTWREIGRAIRKLMSRGWSDVSMSVGRDDA